MALKIFFSAWSAISTKLWYYMKKYNMYVRLDSAGFMEDYKELHDRQGWGWGFGRSTFGHIVISYQIKVLCEVCLWVKWLYRHTCNYTSKIDPTAGNNSVKEIQLKAPGSWGNRGDWYLLKSYFLKPQATGGYRGSGSNSLRETWFPALTNDTLTHVKTNTQAHHYTS